MALVFSFGSQLQKVEQPDKSPKKVFVLGVYASAVHAKWIGVDGKIKVNALAVASEPYIFWKGDNAQEIIDKIQVPAEIGKLIPADKRFSGPSGKALDELFLKPIGYTRKDAWLCDLLPYSRINPNQLRAIDKHYNPLIKKFNLPECAIPKFSARELSNPERVNEIVDELEQSQAGKIILLGDLPIKHFLSYFSGYRKLSDFDNTEEEYGKEHSIKINNKTYQVIPLVHPRQAAALGRSNKAWKGLHERWAKKDDGNIVELKGEMKVTSYAYEYYFGPNFRKIKNSEFPKLNTNVERKYVQEFFLKSIAYQKYDAANKPVVFYILRRSQQIVQLWKKTKNSFNTLAKSNNNKFNSYLNSLNNLELIVSLLYQIYHLMINLTGEKLFKANDNSPLDRLNRCYNIIKHFELTTLPENINLSTYLDNDRLWANNTYITFNELKELIDEVIAIMDRNLAAK